VNAVERSRRLAVGAGALVVLLAAIDAYVVVTVLVTMVGDLGVPVNHIERASLVITAFLLGYVAGMPLLGPLSDRFGRRSTLQWCLAGFAAGSATTALATSLPVLVAGRCLQGLAGGALLPITMALAGDLWHERRRAAVLGGLGAAQELGSVIGPLYGAAVAALLGWRGIFWINVPIALAGVIAVRRAVPGGGQPERPRISLVRFSAREAGSGGGVCSPMPRVRRSRVGFVRFSAREAGSGGGVCSPMPRVRRSRVDVAGGALLAAALGLFVAGLYNPDAERSALPPWGWPCVAAGAIVLACFAAWEARARTRLLELRDARRGALFAALGVSLLSGAALMTSLVHVQLVAQTLFGRTATGGALLLTRFLVPLAVAALLGGLLARRYAERWIVFGGMLLAAAGYARIASWPAQPPVSRVSLDLAVAGLGLGLVIAPLSAVALRSVPASRHGTVSAAVVVARMMGMLIGVAALGAWGVHRFHTQTAHLVTPLPIGMSREEFARRLAAYLAAVRAALRAEYADIFWATAAVCAVAALLGLAIGRRSPAADPDPASAATEPDPTVGS
jgi:MFS family permease